jgi:hypothetical protein
MGADPELVDRVRRILARRPDVVEKRMVGGISFLVGGTMCCGVAGSALMVRVGPDAMVAALAEPHVRPMEMGGRRLGAFVLVDPEGVRTNADVKTWIRRGLDFVSTLPAPGTRR